MQNRSQFKPRKSRHTFVEYFNARYGPHILPIVPPNAPISPRTKSLAPDKLGKTPGQWSGDGYLGLLGWPVHQTTADEAARWDADGGVAGGPTSIGLQGRAFPAFDGDINDPGLADRCKAVVLRVAGAAPARHVTDAETGLPGARFALFYRCTEPLGSWVIKFTDPAGETHMAEFKANKAQMVVQGAHRKGGEYTFPSGPDLVELGADNLTEITADGSHALRDAILAWIADEGCVVVSSAGRTAATTNGQPDQVGEPAPSLADVKAALAAVPNRLEFDRNELLKIAYYVQGACAGLEEDGFGLFADWVGELNLFESTLQIWEGLTKPSRTGWRELARWAHHWSKGAFRSNISDFPDDQGGPREQRTPEGEDIAAARAAAVEEMFATQVWVENQERVFDLRDQRLRNRQQFNAHFAKVTKKGVQPWDVFMGEPDKPTPLNATSRRQTVFDMTYMPGTLLFVGEGMERRVNVWRPAEGIPDGPVSDDDVRLWLDHVLLMVPDPVVRGQLLDWMASVVQRQAEKPNHGVVIGGKHGIGKSMLIEPMRRAFGLHNVQEILASELDSTFSGWLAQAKLFVVEEMMNFQKKEMMQRLKTYLAAPPHTLMVNPKYGKTFTIPNLVAGMFFTNHEDAVAIEAGERRFFVIWSDAEKQPAAYFAELARWYRDGGAVLAARWLLQRDTSGYNMLGEAPHTAARDDMRKSTLSKLDELIETWMEDRVWPLSPDLVALDEVRAIVSRRDLGQQNAPTAARVGRALIDAGAVKAHPSLRRPAIGSPPPGYDGLDMECSPKQARLMALRNHHLYVGKSNAELVALFWEQRIAALKNLDGEVK